MPYFVPANGFRQQVDEFAKQLSYLADEGVKADDDEGSPTRAISYLVEIPDARTGIRTTFDYREEFQRVAGGWLRSRYFYELRISPTRNESTHSRKAHHLHDVWGIHQHCRASTSADDVHYADVERLLQPTHELFVHQFASSSPIECSGLVPLSKR